MLRCLVALCDNNMNVSAAAQELNMLQPAMSKTLILLEKEIGALFLRRGRRLTGLTLLGREVLHEARNILFNCDNIEALRRRHDYDNGDIRIGTTHLQARYILPSVVKQYLREFAKANIQILQNTPANLVNMVENNQVDIIICTEALDHHSQIEAVSAYRWNRSIIFSHHHPLAQQKRLTLKNIATYPLVTYVRGFTGRAAFDRAFRQAGVSFNVAVAAADSDVIKTYVRMGTGVGVIAAIAYDSRQDKNLMCRSVRHLFPDMEVKIAFMQNRMITDAMRRFMDIFRHHASSIGGELGAS